MHGYCQCVPDVILVTEVLPKAQVNPIAPALLELPGLDCFTSFDPSTHNLGGRGAHGICIYIRHELHAAEISFPGMCFKEQLWLKIKLQGSDSLASGCIYRSPSEDPHQSVEQLSDLLCAMVATKPSHLVIARDFNLPEIDWLLSYCPSPDSHHAHKFLDAVHDCLLFQHVTCPTTGAVAGFSFGGAKLPGALRYPHPKSKTRRIWPTIFFKRAQIIKKRKNFLSDLEGPFQA